MGFLSLPSSHPALFWAIAIIWSAFQVYAGRTYGHFIGTGNEKVSAKEREVSYGLHHAGVYFACSLAGFAAWAILNAAAAKVYRWSDIEPGTGAVLIAVALLAVAGISGALPRILYLGNKPV